MSDEVSLHPPDDAQRRFLRLFLSSEREVLRAVMAVVPHLEDARDVVQEAAVALWERFTDYDPARPFAPWACAFATNLALRWAARRRRWKALLDGGLGEVLARRRQEMLPEMDVRFRHLDHCLKKLPPDQRRLVEGYYHRQRPVADLSAELGRTEEAVYKALQRVRAALRACVERTAVPEADE